mgnify:CR=1 FL=1
MAPGILTNGQSKMFPHVGNRSIISGRFEIAILFENVIRWETSLITFGDYFAFLQPISFNNNSIKDIPGYDYNLLHWYMRGDIIGHKVIFPGFEIFEIIKKELQKPPYNKFFFNLNSLDTLSIKKDPFTLDNIHYKDWFSKEISNTIYERIFISRNNNISQVQNFISPLSTKRKEYCGLDISSYKDHISFSSNSSSVGDISSIFDNNTNTFWEARQELPFVINLDYESELIKIDKIFLKIGKNGNDSLNRNPSAIDIFASNDGKKWIPISEIKIDSNIKNGENKEYKICNA